MAYLFLPARGVLPELTKTCWGQMMTFKSGLRALALGVAMVCGTGGAKAITINSPLVPMGNWGIYEFQSKGGPSDFMDVEFEISVASDNGGGYFGPVAYVGLQFVTLFDHTIHNPSVITVRGGETFQHSIHIPLDGVTAMKLGSWIVAYAGYDLHFVITYPDHLGPLTASLNQTPLPGALPLFASVLGIGGWLGYRRKRAKREAVAAAA